MATKAATYLAFNTIVKRTLTTSTPTRAFPRPNRLNFHTPHQNLASRASRGRKLPKNHFTSNSPSNDSNSNNDKEKPSKEPKNKRKAGINRQSGSTSLRRVAVEAQRSRGSPIKGFGKKRHINPDAVTKDVTCYCAAEEYNLHIAKDLLKQEGYKPDPFDTGLFPNVLHVQTPPGWFRGKATADTGDRGPGGDDIVGDVFIFPSGSVVTWNVEDTLGRRLTERILAPAATNGDPSNMEVEDLDYIEDPTREHSTCVGDTIILGTKPSSTPEPDVDSLSSITATTPSSSSTPSEGPTSADTTLAKIAYASALARSTKLAVLENALAAYMQATRKIPRQLSLGQKPTGVTRAFILRQTGTLLSLRGQLNLYSELTDSLPDIFWDSPHELGLENYYDQLSSGLDVEVRIKLLNEKMDYASETAAVLRERLSEQHGHRLEWIIIWLIVIEVLFGCYHIIRERKEKVEEDSWENLAREWYLKETEKARRREREG